ncbi:putative ras-related Rab-7a [Clavispora lusitaniae]|uniref:Ras-related Rab-7a n=1 Tax=Clavispora lusitaniae TaxID=36911 RepID=A0ACD0WPD5_CLALS|nr:putative ras-related Rab-7a [Clavispora lusitaniae]QFZ34813.1 putative ras-related Rab-7a [Clavispora lusitaniae]QFZ40498.1 putative ras-related Rab-7a [Clavispora lusitaniae]QFZ46178.1 putative ras-related Rab-7a [Clavispora lusitaniae]QFZ51840.1 putative ras-related Rab-7a [Clavispora lusitaniae]
MLLVTSALAQTTLQLSKKPCLFRYSAHMAQSAPNSDSAPSNIKVVILGDSGVGKTCLRSQFVHHVFTNAYKATIGGDYLTTTIEIEDKSRPLSSTEGMDGSRIAPTTKVNLQIWDTAGQERFNSISKAFYRGADVAVFVYDITNYESLLSIRDWFARFLEHCHVEKPGVVIVGNKSDKGSERCIDHEEVPDILCRNSTTVIGHYVENWESDSLEVSCKQLALVEEVFRRVAELGLSLASRDINNKSIVEFDGIDFAEGAKSPVSRCAC